MIISNDHPDARQPPRSEAWCVNISHELKEEIATLRTYPIIVELVLTQTLHKRKLILNYLNGTVDKGFAIFRPFDGKTVRDDNDFRCDRIFNRLESNEGDSDYVVVETVLTQLKRKCNSVKQFIGNAGQMTQHRILGDCKPDFSITNRLINDV